MFKRMLALLMVGCSTAPPSVSDRPTPIPTVEPGRAVLWAQLAAPQPDLYYYGDMHFHSGFSADNRGDQEPLAAYQSACQRTEQLAQRYGPGLGGFFLFVTDHIRYVKTRPDMDEEQYQRLRAQADDPGVDRRGPRFTFTALPGAELTGLARGGHPRWDDKFGHLNLLSPSSVAEFVETDVSANPLGGEAMDRFAADPTHLGQFNHPGYNGEPRTGDDADHLYPYTPERDVVFRFIEVNDDLPQFWEAGVAQYNVCLRQGYHVAPVVGTDIYNTKGGLTGQARTVIVMPSTLGRPLSERRAMLLEYARLGRVYATENPTVEILWSVDGYSMGSRLPRPRQAVVELRVACSNAHVARVELLGDAGET